MIFIFIGFFFTGIMGAWSSDLRGFTDYAGREETSDTSEEISRKSIVPDDAEKVAPRGTKLFS